MQCNIGCVLCREKEMQSPIRLVQVARGWVVNKCMCIDFNFQKHRIVSFSHVLPPGDKLTRVGGSRLAWASLQRARYKWELYLKNFLFFFQSFLLAKQKLTGGIIIHQYVTNHYSLICHGESPSAFRSLLIVFIICAIHFIFCSLTPKSRKSYPA